MKKVCYLRVSTEDQSLDSQRLYVEKYLMAHKITAEFYCEYGSGGSTKKRPIFNRLMAEVRSGEIDSIIVYRLDRFARNTKDFLVAHEEIEKAGCRFISVCDNLDLSTPVGRMFAQMLSIFAEFERNILSDRTKAGLAAARARGVRLGPPLRDIDMSRVNVLRGQGLTVREIAKTLGFGKSALYERLKGA